MKRLRFLYLISLIAISTLGAEAQELADSIADMYGDLDEFVLTVKKDLVKSDGAKLTYDMESDASSKGQTLLEALRKVPMITVDGQDQIYIKGNTDFKIYVNGREDPMLTANYKTVFKSMPADAVTKIEVITEPGAKYDAEGTGGILNLVTERKQTKEGYAGSASLSAGTQQFVASLYGKMKKDKVNADANINYVNNSLQKQSSISYMDVYYPMSDENRNHKSEINQKFAFDYLGVSLNLSWEPSVKDLFTFGGNMTSIDATIKKLDSYNKMYDSTGALQWSSLQQGSGAMNNKMFRGNGSYKRLFNEDGHSIILAYCFNYGKSDMKINSINSIDYGETYISPYQSSKTNNFQREHTATLDYTLPLADEKYTIEIGGKGVFRRNSSFTGNIYSSDPIEEALSNLDSDEGNVRQIQDVYAVYAANKGNYGKVSTTLGLRYEHTYMGLDFSNPEYSNFRRHLNDITPNAAVTYMFNPAANLRLAYQMRISRPSVNQMNPQVFQISQSFATVGNPNLESEKVNNVSLTYSNYGRIFGGNIAVSYSLTNNSIEEFQYTSEGTTYQTFGNFGKRNRAELSGFLNWNINPRMSLAVNGSINFSDIKAKREGLENHGWNGNYGMNWNYKGPWEVKYTVYGGQATGHINLQGRDNGWYYYGLSLGKSFLKDDALTVTINANNFLTKFQSYKSKSYSDCNVIKTCWKHRSWDVGLSISWNFGHLQDKVKKTDANIDNDDAKTTDKKGGIGF